MTVEGEKNNTILVEVGPDGNPVLQSEGSDIGGHPAGAIAAGYIEAMMPIWLAEKAERDQAEAARKEVAKAKREATISDFKKRIGLDMVKNWGRKILGQ